MKQELNPIQIVVSIAAVLIVVAIVGIMVFAKHPTDDDNRVLSGPQQPEIAQVVGPGASKNPLPPAGPPPAGAQLYGAGAK